MKKKIAQLDSDTLFKLGKAGQVQQSQLFDLQDEADAIRDGLDTLEKIQSENEKTGKELMEELDNLLKAFQGSSISDKEKVKNIFEEYETAQAESTEHEEYQIKRTCGVVTHNSWETYYKNLSEYAEARGMNDEEDFFLTSLGESEYKKLQEEVNGEFEKRTSIRNKTDLKFLTVAIALEVAKGLLYPLVAEKAGYGQAFDPNERLNHNDPSIERAHKEANDKYRDRHSARYGNGKWEEFLYRTVPYDITKGTGEMPDINLHGGAHRLYTLGHDPILGWIFGTANILTDIITVSPGAAAGANVKLAGIRSYRIERKPVMRVTQERVSVPTLFRESFEVARENPMNLPAAVFAEAQHLKSDQYTKMGLPVPVLEVLTPKFASKLYSDNYDALCLERDMKVIGKSAAVSIFIDMIIGLTHGLFYNPKSDGGRELYEVRTRKILLTANVIGSSSNLIFTCFSQNLKAMDIGGLLVTLSHLFCDPKFILKVKKEFIEEQVYRKIEKEIQELDNLEYKLSAYGRKHGKLYE